MASGWHHSSYPHHLSLFEGPTAECRGLTFARVAFCGRHAHDLLFTSACVGRIPPWATEPCRSVARCCHCNNARAAWCRCRSFVRVHGAARSVGAVVPVDGSFPLQLCRAEMPEILSSECRRCCARGWLKTPNSLQGGRLVIISALP